MSYLLSPVSPAINEFPDVGSKWKERNDRQLRLWGIHGQDRIDNANVCLLNASAVGAEVLKNIILPGFGKFSVVDGKTVEARDLGVNFFVCKEGLGKNRAEVVTTALAELNPDVTGTFCEKEPAEVLENKPEFFDPFNMLIASNMDLPTLRKFAKYCYEKDKILVVVRTYGMLGYIRTIAKSHEVVEAKPDQEIDDLRLSSPWPELLKFCETQDLDSMDEKTLYHTPYPIILILLVREWKKKHGHLPTTRAERQDFVQMIISKCPSPLNENENFKEAVDKHFQACNLPEIPEEVQKIFDDPMCNNLTAKSPDFWFLVYAVKQFVQNEGQGTLPVQGRLPDMHSDTERYIKLQTIYRKKARSDMAAVKKYLELKLKEVGKENTISDMDIKEFCKNAYYLRVFHFRSLEEELKDPNKETIRMHLENSESTMPWYIMLRAVDIYFEKYGHYPGQSGNINTDDEFEKLFVIVKKLTTDLELTNIEVEWEKYTKEMVRFGAAEIHNIASLMGGVGGQELIKLCTKQRIVLNNTWIFSGINAKATAFYA
jgi:amyloid beta precursor protein binding protein 1